MLRMIRWIGFLAAVCALTASAARAERPEQCVARYMRAWVAGDWTTVQSLWDAPSRRMISATDLRNRCTLVLNGDDAGTVRLRKALGKTTVSRCRPERFSSVVVRQTSATEVDVDCKARFSFRSEYGVPFALMLPKLIADTPKGSSDAFYMVLAAKSADDPVDVDTSAGAARTISVLPGTPDIVLSFQRFHLVKENGQWRISNAVSMAK